MGDALVAYGHYLAMMALFSALLGEHLLLSGSIDKDRARQLVITDRVYLGSAALVLVTGLARLGYFGKGGAFYVGSWLFFVKIGLFVLLVLLSIYPKMQLRALRSAVRSGNPPAISAEMRQRLKTIVMAELGIVTLIPLVAVLMGRGFGY